MPQFYQYKGLPLARSIAEYIISVILRSRSYEQIGDADENDHDFKRSAITFHRPCLR